MHTRWRDSHGHAGARFLSLLASAALVGGVDAQTPIDSAELAAPASEISGVNVILTVKPSVLSRRYQLQSSDSIMDQAWENLGAEHVGDGGNLVITTPFDPGTPHRFYRLALDPAPPVLADGFVLIPAGTFQMGNTFSEGSSDELPVHSVHVSAFFMAKYEVTKALWDEVKAWAVGQGYDDLPTGGGKAPNHPVHFVSWYAMVKWCNAHSEREMLTPCYTVSGATYERGNGAAVVCNWDASGYRLPTEAEWEKAGRGGTSDERFPWGNTISHSQANYQSHPRYAYNVSTTRDHHPTYEGGALPYSSPVGSFAPNSYGLYDMVGNMWEWCWDRNSPTYYGISLGIDPRDPASGQSRSDRGSSWADAAEHGRVANRDSADPAFAGYNNIGFRLVRGAGP